jgi:hypothetical protein
MSETNRLEQAFHAFVVALFSEEKYRIHQVQGGRGSDQRVDLMVSTPEGQNAVVEIKLFRTRIVSRANIINAVAQLDKAREVTGTDRGILIISSSLAIPVTDIGNNEIWDMKKLGEKAARHPSLVPLFESLSRELSSSLPISDFDIHSYMVFGDAITGEPHAPVTEPAQEGGKLEKALRAVRPGKRGARDLEAEGFEALKYIFRDDLSNWSKQKVTDGGISRFDVIARISSNHDFWQSLLQFFHTWYVVFEFKNHGELIKQGQIYTTEKYLFAGAMRLVAFIISRKGGDKNALAATRGAVRESGKLIVNLSLDDIYKMLQMKDNGDDPNAILFDILDEMLMKLER